MQWCIFLISKFKIRLNQIAVLIFCIIAIFVHMCYVLMFQKTVLLQSVNKTREYWIDCNNKQ
jgi:hypothetical protein